MINFDEVREQVLEIQELSNMTDEEVLKDFGLYCEVLGIEQDMDAFEMYHSDAISFL